MNVEEILRKIPAFRSVRLDTVLFESKYPVMFTCRNGEDIYLFICCLVSADKLKWIGTKTDYNTLIRLLENGITIRDAFLNVTDEKLLIEYDGRKISCAICNSEDIPDKLLPTAGEYMDAEEGEFTEEIHLFKVRNNNYEYRIKPYISSFWILSRYSENIRLSDEYFNIDLKFDREISFNIGKVANRSIKYA